jgi:hypothetical protein
MRCIALLGQCVNTIQVIHWCHCCCHYLSLANIRICNCASQATHRCYEWRFTTPKNHVYTWSLIQNCIYNYAIHILGKCCRHYTWRCGGVKLAARWCCGGCGWWLCNMMLQFECECGHTINVLGIHLLHCPCKNERTTTHDMLQKIVAVITLESGAHV